MRDLRDKMGKEFVFTTELGPINGTLIEESLEKAKEFRGIDAINIHDCPNAHLRMNSIMAASIFQQKLDITTIPHFTCRDRSLLGTQADLLGAHALGIRYILATTGDGPQHGPYKSSAVYDYNSRQLMLLIKNLNEGKDANGNEIKGHTEFMVSATAMPATKDLDNEVERIARKIQSGAAFIQTQAMYDAEQTKAFLGKTKPLGKPIILGVMPLKGLKMAGFVMENITGINIPEKILKDLESGRTGLEIACDFVQEIYDQIDGLHIFGMGDVTTTNKLIEFTAKLLKE